MPEKSHCNSETDEELEHGFGVARHDACALAEGSPHRIDVGRTCADRHPEEEDRVSFRANLLTLLLEVASAPETTSEAMPCTGGDAVVKALFPLSFGFSGPCQRAPARCDKSKRSRVLSSFGMMLWSS